MPLFEIAGSAGFEPMTLRVMSLIGYPYDY